MSRSIYLLLIAALTVVKAPLQAHKGLISSSPNLRCDGCTPPKQGASGADGPEGPTGPTGPQGPAVAGSVYGEIYTSSDTSMDYEAPTAQLLTTFQAIGEQLNAVGSATPGTPGTITVADGGVFLASLNLSYSSSVSIPSVAPTFSLSTNGSLIPLPNIQGSAKVSVDTVVNSVAFSGIVTLNAGDSIDALVSATVDTMFTIEFANLNLIRIQ